MGKHYSNEDLINRLYGIGRSDSHVEQCEDCRARWEQLLERRREIMEPPEVPAEFLAAQRREVYRRLESNRSWWAWRLGPALATVSVLVLGIVLSRPVPAPEPTLAVNTNGDAEFFAEIYSMVESTEPWAAEPIYGLFEEEQ